MFYLVLINNKAIGQNNGSKIDSIKLNLSNAVSANFKGYPREKTFIHLNQDLYISGQTIWYKIYCTSYGKPTEFSKIAYLQLIASDGKIIKTCKLPLLNGGASGVIDIPDSVKSGWYLVKAFTSWMLNFQADNIYFRKVFIQNRSDTPYKNTVEDKKQTYQVTFFPEGGDIAQDVINTIAFKATDSTGNPVDIHGEIINTEQNRVVVKFNSMHDGMGKFDFEAIPGHYVAKIYFPDREQIVAFPAIKNTVGVRIKTAKQDKLEVKLSCNALAAKNSRKCILAALQQNGVFSTYPVDLSTGVNVFYLEKNTFKTGIVRFTLFNESGAPLLERIVFIDNHDILSLKLKTDSVSFTSGKPSIVNIASGDSSKISPDGDFSVSVTDVQCFPNEYEGDNIVSYFLMSSELKGHVNNPAWYFQKDSVKSELDLVMMTNGWRHFKWDSIAKPVRLRYPIEKSMYIACRIENFDYALFKQDQTAIKMIIINQDSSRYIGAVSPDSTGSFILKNYPFSGTSSLYLEASDKKGHRKNVQFQIIQTITDSLNNTASVPFKPDAVAPYIPEQLIAGAKSERDTGLLARGVMLKTVTIKAKKKSPTELLIEAHAGGRFVSDRTFTLDLVNYPSDNIGIISYMKGKFPGLQIIGDENNAYFIYHGINTLATPPDFSKMTPDKPQERSSAFYPYFYIDHTSATFDDVKELSMTNIALIQFMPAPVWFAPYNGGNIGAIVIYTKKQSDERVKIESKEQFDHFLINGYTISREFYSPPDAQSSNNNGKPRPCIYWNPHLALKDGKIRFSFYNPGSSAYRIVIQGITADGNVGYLTQIIRKR